jgi:NAD(P)-dependent dehydrogenase (short-subunit alcohol dehydrogenase family)
MTTISGKTAIITGGGSGIGEGTALALARAGANVVICGRRRTVLERVVGEIEAEGGIAHAVTADVSQEADVDRVIAETMHHFGAIHFLVNNAGIDAPDRPIHEYNVAEWDRVMATNLRGPFLMSRAVLPAMRRQREGHIINISSEAGIEYYDETGAYTVSKFGLNALGEIIQIENQDLGIRVNTICPGMVVTEMSQNAPGLNKERCLYPEDIADLILFLLTRRPNVKIGRPILIQTMLNPWEAS